jgi:hypothetical protein
MAGKFGPQLDNDGKPAHQPTSAIAAIVAAAKPAP